MNNPENFDTPSDSIGTSNRVLQEENAVLRSLLVASLVGILLMGLAFNYFILRQLIFTRKDLDVVRPQVVQMVDAYTKTEEPQIRNFVNSLITYGRAHPDFNPILAKYKIIPATGAMAAPAPAAVVPATPAAPAKKK